MISEQQLVDSFHAIELSHAGPPGDAFAGSQPARDRILARVRSLSGAPDVDEFRFSMPDHFAELLFVAILKRYDLTPYRYKRQRKLTVMVRASKRLIDDTISPLFDAALRRLQERHAEIAREFLNTAVSPGPYTIHIHNEHDHDHGRLCQQCAAKAAARTPGGIPESGAAG